MESERACLKGAPKGVTLRVVEHPGHIVDGVIHTRFPGKYMVTSDVGAFYGFHPRFLFHDDVSRTSCLSAFHLQEAREFVLEQMSIIEEAA